MVLLIPDLIIYFFIELNNLFVEQLNQFSILQDHFLMKLTLVTLPFQTPSLP